ncbi:WGxxGxxG family protein [Paenibacillus sp. N3.4]|uniref:WGxxGxxG family protein n=1 Tax=Paenibacillus sp. N3.4 TaxID=2603222 RepID=UPI0011C7D5A1|nr:WGxxGxxG family protein [Paenibacillus sp. N3.4]TXK84432.1 hypothetical protein FU659_08370 [Paenibacillus sp. N3.4]
MKKLQTLTMAVVFISAFSFSSAGIVVAQGNAGVGMNSTSGTISTGPYNSLSTSGAYGTSVASGTGSRVSYSAVGKSNDGIISYNNNSSSVRAYSTTNSGANWGWLGLIGLFGLAGSRGRNNRREDNTIT